MLAFEIEIERRDINHANTPLPFCFLEGDDIGLSRLFFEFDGVAHDGDDSTFVVFCVCITN